MPLNKFVVLLCATAIAASSNGALAADKIKVGVFSAVTALPYFVAEKRGYFKEVDLDPETVMMGTPALLVQSLITGSIDASSNVVTLEGANINARRPGTLYYFSLMGQNSEHVVEQFVVTSDSDAKTLADLKGKKLFTSPGPANINTSKAVLAAIGLKDGADYQMQEQPLNVQVQALKSGNFEGGYTVEPLGSIMIRTGVGRRLEAGVISTHLLGDPTALTNAAGPVVSGSLLKQKPDVAARFAAAWAKAVDDIQQDRNVREMLTADLNVPENVARDMALPYFIAVKDLSASQISTFQRFVDLGVEFGVVNSKLDVKSMLAPL